MKLVLVRHGESEWNKLNLFTGWTDVDLSEKGHAEASCHFCNKIYRFSKAELEEIIEDLGNTRDSGV